MATGGFSSYQPFYIRISRCKQMLMIYVYRLCSVNMLCLVLLTKRVEHFTLAIKEIINVYRSYIKGFNISFYIFYFFNYNFLLIKK